MQSVIEAHISSGGEKLLYATLLSGLLLELPALAGGPECGRYLMLAQCAMRGACSTPHEQPRPGQLGIASALH
jgi:hypothetical protein